MRLRGNKNWEYAKLTKDAKQHGGPAGLVDSIEANARKDGREEMYPAVAAAGVLCFGIGYLAKFLKDRYDKKRVERNQKLKAEKQELIKELQAQDRIEFEDISKGDQYGEL